MRACVRACVRVCVCVSFFFFFFFAEHMFFTMSGCKSNDMPLLPKTNLLKIHLPTWKHFILPVIDSVIQSLLGIDGAQVSVPLLC